MREEINKMQVSGLLNEIVQRARATADSNVEYARSLRGRLDAVLAAVEEASKKGQTSLGRRRVDADLIPILGTHFKVIPIYENTTPRVCYDHIISWDKEK